MCEHGLYPLRQCFACEKSRADWCESKVAEFETKAANAKAHAGRLTKKASDIRAEKDRAIKLMNLTIEENIGLRLKAAKEPRPMSEAPKDANIVIIFEGEPEFVCWVPQPHIPGWYRSADRNPIYPDTDQWWPSPTPPARPSPPVETEVKS